MARGCLRRCCPFFLFFWPNPAILPYSPKVTPLRTFPAPQKTQKTAQDTQKTAQDTQKTHGGRRGAAGRGPRAAGRGPRAGGQSGKLLPTRLGPAAARAARGGPGAVSPARLRHPHPRAALGAAAADPGCWGMCRPGSLGATRPAAAQGEIRPCTGGQLRKSAAARTATYRVVPPKHAAGGLASGRRARRGLVRGRGELAACSGHAPRRAGARCVALTHMREAPSSVAPARLRGARPGGGDVAHKHGDSSLRTETPVSAETGVFVYGDWGLRKRRPESPSRRLAVSVNGDSSLRLQVIGMR